MGESFTVTLTLTGKEIHHLEAGEFNRVRKDFFNSSDFCNFVIKNYEINETFIKFALKNLNSLNLSGLFKKYNLFKYPENFAQKLSPTRFESALFYLTLYGYDFIDPIHWNRNFETISNFFGTSETIMLAKKSGIDSKMLRNFSKAHKPASPLFELALLERKIMENDLQALEEFIYSESLKLYWEMEEFVPGACYLLEQLTPKTLPIKKENADWIIKYCQTSTSNYIWGLRLYMEITNSNTISEFVFSQVFPYHSLNFEELISAYKTGTYHITADMYAIVDSMDQFEKVLVEVQPEALQELSKKIFDDIDKDEDIWRGQLFFNSCYIQSNLQRKIALYLKSKG